MNAYRRKPLSVGEVLYKQVLKNFKNRKATPFDKINEFQKSIDKSDLSFNGIVKYVITGDPIPLARPRFNGKVVFDTQKKKKSWIGQLVSNQHRNRPLYKGALHLDIQFYMRIPKYERNKVQYWHIKKPDLSNMIKFYEDICTGILYADDKQIVKITASKFYDEHERTEFTITSLGENHDE